MIENKILYGLDDITLIPKSVSYIRSRSQVDPMYYGDDIPRMPIFISPMSCLIDENNFDTVDELGFNVIMPRSVAWEKRIEYMRKEKWIAVGFKEAEKLYKEFESEKQLYIPHICIDQAQGHSYDLLNLCKKFKKLLGKNIILMTGNIANPETYRLYDDIGVDYIRVGIGGGKGCTTSVQTGMHYPMASLIDECSEIKKAMQGNLIFKRPSNICQTYHTQIIADGGINDIGQIVKALALGADYVMIGELFAETEEACGKLEKYYPDPGCPVPCKNREYYGMSTEKAQKEIYDASGIDKKELGEFKPKHAEGIEKYVNVIYKAEELVDDYKHAMKSAMSYNNSIKLSEFIGRVESKIMTPATYYSYMK